MSKPLEIMKDIYQMEGIMDNEIAELKAENERLKQEWRLDCLKCEYKNTKADVDKYRKTLQEIKEYAECIGNEEMINGYAIRAKSALWRIAQKITKAEEE